MQAVCLKPRIPQLRLLRIDEVAVQPNDERDAELAIERQDMPVDRLLFIDIVILDFQHEAVPEMPVELMHEPIRDGEVIAPFSRFPVLCVSVLPDAAEACRGDKHVTRVKPHQQLHIHTRSVIIAGDIGLREHLVQIAPALVRLRGQNNVAIRVVGKLRIPVLHEVCLCDVAPLEAVLLRQLIALEDIALCSVLAGGDDAVS